MVMVPVPKGTRRVPRGTDHPPSEWTIMLDLAVVGLGKGEVDIGYTERRGRQWRAFPINAATWQDFGTKWIPAVQWLVESYKSWLNTHEPAAAAEQQQVTQQSQADLAGAGETATVTPDIAAPDIAEIDLGWLSIPAEPGPEEETWQPG